MWRHHFWHHIWLNPLPCTTLEVFYHFTLVDDLCIKTFGQVSTGLLLYGLNLSYSYMPKM